MVTSFLYVYVCVPILIALARSDQAFHLQVELIVGRLHNSMVLGVMSLLCCEPPKLVLKTMTTFFVASERVDPNGLGLIKFLLIDLSVIHIGLLMRSFIDI